MLHDDLLSELRWKRWGDANVRRGTQGAYSTQEEFSIVRLNSSDIISRITKSTHIVICNYCTKYRENIEVSVLRTSYFVPRRSIRRQAFYSPHLQEKKKRASHIISPPSTKYGQTYLHYTYVYNMPHSSRTKRPTIAKRTSVTDTDGWTHVTNGGNVRRVMRRQKSEPQPFHEPVLAPAEAPGRLTLSDLQAQFQTHHARWESSESWNKVSGALQKRLKQRSQTGPVDAIVCIGLGSPSGFLRDGWVDRRAVSLYQLAALVSIKDQVECSFHPVLNSSDTACFGLRTFLGIRSMQSGF